MRRAWGPPAGIISSNVTCVSIASSAVLVGSMAECMQRLEFEDFPGRSLTVMLFKDVTNSK
jgi:hypothetical protein